MVPGETRGEGSMASLAFISPHLRLVFTRGGQVISSLCQVGEWVI